jgi:hypothetical protein
MFREGKGGRCLRLTNLLPSCADCLEILGASTSWTPVGLFKPVQAKFFTQRTEICVSPRADFHTVLEQISVAVDIGPLGPSALQGIWYLGSCLRRYRLD